MKRACLRAWTLLTCAAVLGLGSNHLRGFPLAPLGGFEPSLELSRVPRVWAEEILATRPLFLDVRSPEEYRRGHIPGALRSLSGHLSEPIVVYCSLGCAQAFHTVVALQAQGYKHAVVLDRGYEGWIAAGGASRSGEDP